MRILIAVGLLLSTAAFADVNEDFQGLGGNKILLEKAKELNPEKEVSIVQDRVVSRRNRVEIAPEFLGSFGGDTYSRTTGLGLGAQFHINPHWSIGARYAYNFNRLTPEGKAAVDRAEDDFKKNPNKPNAAVPTLDYPKNEYFGTLYWYPIYGKMNLLDKGIAHFDIYALAGYGRVLLSSGSTPSYTAGGGFGFWWTQHFDTRIEMRWQTYNASYFGEKQKLDLAVASMQVGMVAMIRALTFAALIAATPLVQAEDLEGLFEGKGTPPATAPENQLIRGQSLLADAIRSLAQASTPEQNFFMRNLEKQEWSEALINWDTAFGGKPFETTESGKALRAYLQFKSGLPVTGLENLFAIEDAKKIHFLLLNMWREAAPESHPAWLVSRITWKPEFNELFGPAIEVKVKAADLSGAKKIEDLQALSLRAPPDSHERAVIDWHLALAYAKQDKAGEAAKIMATLLKAKNNPVSQDLMNITAARMLFQNGYFEAAQKYYDKVPKKSEDYLEAQEEKAWTFLRRGEPQNAMAVTQSLVNPSLSGQVGPETWFLRALSQIKVCDYTGTLETLRGFPKEFKDHALALEALASNKASQDELGKFLVKMQKGALTRAELVRSTHKLPRNLTRDERLKYLLSSQLVLEKEAEGADILFAKSLKTTGLQGHFDTLRSQTLERSQNAKAAAIARAQELAREELDETHKMVNKMHIVETELIQQVDAAPRISKNLGVKDKDVEIKKGTTGSLARDTLKFPKEDEFWFDELTNYRVDVKKGCQVRVTR